LIHKLVSIWQLKKSETSSVIQLVKIIIYWELNPFFEPGLAELTQAQKQNA
jgi:hypothetical protein